MKVSFGLEVARVTTRWRTAAAPARLEAAAASGSPSWLVTSSADEAEATEEGDEVERSGAAGARGAIAQADEFSAEEVARGAFTSTMVHRPSGQPEEDGGEAIFEAGGEASLEASACGSH